jgi:hypothetical protein
VKVAGLKREILSRNLNTKQAFESLTADVRLRLFAEVETHRTRTSAVLV